MPKQKQKQKYFDSENILEEFYLSLANEDEKTLQRVHIPHSDVFYVREAIFQHTGQRYTLDRVERCMYLEGFLNADDVLDPERTREWES